METKIKPELLQLYAFWSGVMIVKVLFVVFLTAGSRFVKGVFINEDDYSFLGMKKTKVEDPDIERIRRCHHNDLENVIPWLIITYIWLWINPPLYLAKILIPVFGIARIIHTLAYAVFPQQPTRALSFGVGFVIMLYEAYSVIIHFY